MLDLRQLSAQALEPVLQEETSAWLQDLDWDFEKSADLVRRFVDLHALSGSALVQDGEVLGYAYYVMEENKGLIGDLYLLRRARTVERENQLLEAVLTAMTASGPVVRIEAQLMMLLSRPCSTVPLSGHARAYERNFMRVELRKASLGEGRIDRPVYFERWSDHYQQSAAQVIAAAYLGHVDGNINDQYRSVAGARRFLHNIVQYPGCGTFYRPASFAAFEGLSGRLCGVCLTSLVAPDSGHITQLCVSPTARGLGVGHELLRQSLTALRDFGCRTASLTVTASNAGAVKLYEQVGLRTVKRFSAYVWAGF